MRQITFSSWVFVKRQRSSSWSNMPLYTQTDVKRCRSLVFNLGARRVCVVSATTRSLYAPGKIQDAHFWGGCVGPRAVLNGYGEDKILPPPPQVQVPDSPSLTLSLYRISYVGLKILAFTFTFIHNSQACRQNTDQCVQKCLYMFLQNVLLSCHVLLDNG